jgi:hypothetical protein
MRLLSLLLTLILADPSQAGQMFPFGFWKASGPSFLSISGCSSLTTDGDYKVCSVTSSATLTVTGGPYNVDYLVIAGGGSGAGTNAGGYGGGGSGGYREFTATSLSSGSYSVVIGAGATGAAAGANGSTGLPPRAAAAV